MTHLKWFFLLLGVCLAFQMEATIWRVNKNSNYDGNVLYGDNVGGTFQYPVFKEINEAVNFSSVVADDTLHIEASSSPYSLATITKPLVIIGNGYFLNENPQTGVVSNGAQVAGVTFAQGSSGSSVQGLTINPQGLSGTAALLQVSNIDIRRCRILSGITMNSNLSDITINQCFISLLGTVFLSGGFGQWNSPTSFIFCNNIVDGTLTNIPTQGITFDQCNNNLFTGNLTLNASQFYNNIVTNPSATVNINNGTNQNVQFATGTMGQFGGTPGHVAVGSMTGVLLLTGSTDGQYDLVPSWANANPGFNGQKRGPFGGLPHKQYVLSGLPNVPLIYSINYSGVATPSNGMSVTIGAKSMN